MKEIYVQDIKDKIALGTSVTLFGWTKNKRDHGSIIFIDVCDSTGSIQAIVDKGKVANEIYGLAKNIVLESSIRVVGHLQAKNSLDKNTRSIEVQTIKIIGEASYDLMPRPRSDFDVFDPLIADHLLRNRHLYIRNDKLAAVLRFRHGFMGILHQWFRTKDFVEITAPILTPLPLYDDHTALSLSLGEEKIFLTQCVAFYLESALPAFEKVYNIGPSFRGEESRSKRHLMEYWHVKAEIAFADLEDTISCVEIMLRDIISECEEKYENEIKILGVKLPKSTLSLPYPRISYREAISILKTRGIDFELGKSLSSKEETVLACQFETPFWITNLPRDIEPFPYMIDASDPSTTKTADLIAPGEFGELLGVAEKITDPLELQQRLEEKGKDSDSRYKWYSELRRYGCVPHSGFGMGVERVIRWLLKLSHVRDAIPFPRIFRRKVYP
ncbi:MAG: hypothetical protein COS47_01685 [Candidatus Nealsonbacteria bacterium CG03_land_8_20_14_0_80_36_12]|uniref:Aminoacyl-transfer RNA synthetases class-II family profile domain-containing protein n=1 Tax=Candidatus Nealsonbacteria bacterium CG03_land_8_20_14_0_80_36_12 TaxID=1974701 RepID=A0A2M7BY56_9BACT|nr:MAG: hypothetical protein COS47_01685 [Candidatus Nealsonbacteria bacterium CG03_land_8_20_14_0_80_36_12]